MHRLSVLTAVLVAVLLLGGAGTALAEPPFRLAERVTDRAGVLDPGEVGQVVDATDRLRSAQGIDLFVVYVASFDGMAGQEWADRTAELSQLGTEDVVLAVAVQDRAYGVSAADGLPVSESTLDAVRIDDVEPRLAEGDWSGAAIAMADGLSGAGGVPVAALVIGGLVVVGGGAYLVTRRRRRATAPAGGPLLPPPAGDALRDEFSDVSAEDLGYRASEALIEVDDAVRTSEQELAAARAHFGDEAVAEFAAALEHSRADMLHAFELRQRLDDDQPEDERARRALHAEIIRSASAADDRLDAQVDAFDRLRGLEARAPEYIAGLGARLNEVGARVPEVDELWTTMQARYAGTALEPVAGALDQARQLLTAASTELTQARTEATAAAVLSGRAAEDAITQAEVLLDGVGRRETELGDAAGRIPAARADVEQDLAEARATGGPTLPPVVARAEAAIAAADRAADDPLPDPIAALRLLGEAGDVLDRGLAEAHAARDRAQRAAAALEQALLTARSAIAAAEDFITTRRGAVGGPARTRLAEARRHLQLAAGSDPVVALHEAQQADVLAQESLRLARNDVARWSVPSTAGGGALAGELGSLILGGILSGAAGGLRGSRRGGSRSRGGPGSFGGSSRRGRRGGGGRF